MEQIVLQTRDLTKRFGSKTAVDAVNMCIRRGDIYGFIGKNGAGKTTFMRMVVGTAFPTSGEMTLFGGEEPGAARRKIGALIEAPAFYGGCTARENMRRFALLYGGTETEIDEILSYVGLWEAADKKVKTFSLGMKQRMGVALALLGNPEFLLLDEPVNGLDPTGMKEVRDLILRLNREKGITFLISSHLLDELAKVVTRYGIIDSGRLVEEITPEEIDAQCRHELQITVNDTAKALALITAEVPAEQVSVSGNVITVQSHTDDGAHFNTLLTVGGVEVSGIRVNTVDMEQFFMERLGN